MSWLSYSEFVLIIYMYYTKKIKYKNFYNVEKRREGYVEWFVIRDFIFFVHQITYIRLIRVEYNKITLFNHTIYAFHYYIYSLYVLVKI